MTLTVAFLATIPAAAADGPAGAYRLTASGGDASFTVLLSFSQQANRWTGQFLGSLDLAAKLTPTVTDVRVTGDRLRFTLALTRNEVLTFDGKLPTGRGPIPGTLPVGDGLVLVTLEPSALTKFDRAGFSRRSSRRRRLDRCTTAPSSNYSRTAREAKATPAEVKAWADRAAKAAEANGIRWQMYVLLRMSRVLADQPANAAVALDLAHRAEASRSDKEVGVPFVVLDLLKRLLAQTNNAAAIEPVQTRIDTLEARDFRDYLAVSPLKPELYRSKNSQRSGGIGGIVHGGGRARRVWRRPWHSMACLGFTSQRRSCDFNTI